MRQEGKLPAAAGTPRRKKRPGEGYRALAAAQLQRVAGLDACDPALMHNWVDAAKLVHVPRGAVICRRGAPCTELLLVIEGAVLMGRYLGQKDAHVVIYLRPGDLHGCLQILAGGPQIYDMMAHEASLLLSVPAELVKLSIAQHVAVREAFEAQLAHHYRIACDRLFDAVCQPLSYRLARQLDYLGKYFGAQRSEGLRISISVSQADLARALGASRQQVNAALKKFEQRGLISLARAKVVIRDPQALEAAGYSNLPFTLTRSAPEPAAPASARQDRRDGKAELRGRRVLLVEDDSVSRMIFATQIRGAGAQVDEAESGDMAVELVCAAAAPYDMIVMDEHMLGMSGSMATRRIREYQAQAGQSPTPILGVSGDAGRDDTRRFIAAGMNAHLAKPVGHTELVAAIKELLD